MNEENQNEQVENSVEINADVPEVVIQKRQPNKILIGGSAALVLLLGFIFINKNSGPSEEQCNRIMLTQIFFDGRISAANLGTISSLELITAWTTGLEDLGNATKDLSGNAKEDGDQIFADAAGVGISLSTGSSLAQSYNDMTTGYEDFEATYCK